MKRETKNRLIAVRLSDEDLLILRRRAERTGVPVSTQIRDLIRNAEDPFLMRERAAALKKIRTDLSYCRHRIFRACSEDTAKALLPVFADCRDALTVLAKGDEADGDHEAGSP